MRLNYDYGLELYVKLYKDLYKLGNCHNMRSKIPCLEGTWAMKGFF